MPCYTFGGLWGETFDIRTARKLAAVCNLSHEVIRINDQFLQDFGKYARKASTSLMGHTMRLAPTTYISMRWHVALPQFV